MSSQAVYCLSLQIQSNANGKTSANLVPANSNVSAVTTAAATTTTTTSTTKLPIEPMQPQQQQSQTHQQPQQQQFHHAPQPQLTNNIILLRGSRNENGQIVIQNKHDIISFINEQQQQQQNDKSTAVTLSSLPNTTTVARKSSASGISLVSAGSHRDSGSGNVSLSLSSSNGSATSNTILLQTPINASQLESVLLQTANLKKSAAVATSSGSVSSERPLLFKNAARSLSTDSNRQGSVDNKGPFVLQTLKRLEKSQSILVIRNSSSAAAATQSTHVSTTSANTANASTSTSERKSISPPSLSTSSSTASSSSLSSSSLSLGLSSPTTASVSTNTQTGALSFTRAIKGQQTTKLGNITIAGNRTFVAASQQTASTAATASNAKTQQQQGTSTTYFRLGSATTATLFASNAREGNKAAGNNKSHNSNVASAASNNFANNGNRSIPSGVTVDGQLSLADVQLKQERNRTTSPSTSSTTSSSQTQHLQLQQQANANANAPLGTDGEPIKLPDNLESLPRADSFPSQRHRWNTNEEIAAILISFDKHSEWQSKEVRTRPKSGSLLLYSRKKVRYRRDGYCWKKRKDGKTTREDHMKLKVQGTECIYGCYVHSAILPTFHRRCYWLLQNPDIVLVHYLNVPYPDDNKMAVIAPSITLWGDKKEWTKEELVSQLKPMLSTVTSDDDSDSGNDIEISTAETVESIVCQLMEKQRISRQAALVKQLDCGCGDANCADGKTCSHPVMRRPSLLKTVNEKRVNLNDNYNHSATSSPNVVIGPKLYSRWSDRRPRDTNMDNHQYHPQQLPQETAIKFQVIPPQHNEQHQQHHANFNQQQQQYRQHALNNTNTHQLFASRNNLIIQQQQQQPQQHGHHQPTANQSNFNQTAAPNNVGNHNNQINLQRFVGNHNANTNNNSNNNNSQITQRLQIAKTTATGSGTANENVELIGSQNHMATNSNSNKINRNNQVTITPHQQQQQQQQNNELNVVNNNSQGNSYSYSPQQQQNSSNHTHTSSAQQHLQQQHQQQFYKLPNKSSTNDAKLSSLQPQATTHSSNTNSSLVEPMCISPEHHPQTPAVSSPTTASPSTSAVTQSIADAVGVNQQPSATSSPGALVAGRTDAEAAENLISPHAANIGVEDNNDSVEMSSNNDSTKQQQQQQRTSNNNINNNDNQKTEYNIKTTGNTPNGCANIDASTDNSNPNSSPSSKTHNHTIDFETMELNNNGGNEQSAVEPTPHELHDSLSFFNETLDLSQEDIQRTLIANMPYGTGIKHEAGVVGLHTIDFMGTNIVAHTPQEHELPVPGVTCEPDDEDADDVFANLDAFDMLVEFPELDLDDKQALSHTALEQAANLDSSSDNLATTDLQPLVFESENKPTTDTKDTPNASVNTGASLQQPTRKPLHICDFSPEWSYPEGGVKVLVAGPWTSSATYTVLFDAHPVPTVLVQEGVLRCYCPAHDVGFVTLQVSCGGFVVSNTVMFEYKMSLYQEIPFDASSNDCLYKFTLLNRLSTIDEKMQIKAEAGKLSEELFLQSNFEEKLVSYCHQLTKRLWQINPTATWTSGFRGMTLLHLAAMLGYPKLVCAMLNWRSENPNIILETEIDALSQDVYGFTPLTWACARGHLETASILYKWNHNALKIKNYSQQSPLDVANLKGHKTLLAEIYRLEHERHRKQHKTSTMSSLSINLNKHSLTDINLKSLNTTDEHIFDIKEGDHIFSMYDPYDVQRRHDGVFLRPIALASNQSPPNSSRFSKRSSVDSGINMDIKTKPGKTFKETIRLHSFDNHDSFNLAVESPLDTLTSANTTNSLLSPLRKMDFALCEVSTGDTSPLTDQTQDHDDTSTINNDDMTDINNETDGIVGDSDAKVLTLAEHIIAAMPERIKNEADEMMVLGSPMTEPLNSESSGLNDSFMDPLLDSLPNTHFDSDFSFDFNDHSYRYHDVSTPCSSLSPASSGPLQSPASYSILGADLSVSSPSPPPSTKQLTEFLHASTNNQYPFEADFSKLTLTDTEQRELYEAAKCIQKAYRSYKGRQKLEEQNKERTAAIVIQNYYRRYKQYAYYRQMTNAALVIQHGYRSYRRNKRFKKSQPSTIIAGHSHVGSNHNSSNSQCLSSFYDHYKNDQQLESQPSTPKETSPSGPLKRTYSQSTQNQAARKIQQFMRQSRIKLQRERAEKEKLVHQRREEYLQSLRFQGQPEIVCSQEKSKMETA